MLESKDYLLLYQNIPLTVQMNTLLRILIRFIEGIDYYSR